jgi:hypothetical protein
MKKVKKNYSYLERSELYRNSCPVRRVSLRIMIALGIGTQGVQPVRARYGASRFFPAPLGIGGQCPRPVRARLASIRFFPDPLSIGTQGVHPVRVHSIANRFCT